MGAPRRQDQPRSCFGKLCPPEEQDWLRNLVRTVLFCGLSYKVYQSVLEVQAKRVAATEDVVDAATLMLPSVTFCPRCVQIKST